MRTLDVQARLEYARAAVAVLRGLQVTGRTMKYGEFAAAIGVKTQDEKWEVWHRNQITEVLNLAAAAEHQGRPAGSIPLEFERIVTGAANEPGEGFYKKSRIVTD
jgi:hypothetical protein